MVQESCAWPVCLLWCLPGNYGWSNTIAWTVTNSAAFSISGSRTPCFMMLHDASQPHTAGSGWLDLGPAVSKGTHPSCSFDLARQVTMKGETLNEQLRRRCSLSWSDFSICKMLKFKQQMTMADHDHHSFNINGKHRVHNSFTHILISLHFGKQGVADVQCLCYIRSLHHHQWLLPHPIVPSEKKTHLSAVKSRKFEPFKKNKTKAVQILLEADLEVAGNRN